jgi:hypothetical protein
MSLRWSVTGNKPALPDPIWSPIKGAFKENAIKHLEIVDKILAKQIKGPVEVAF